MGFFNKIKKAFSSVGKTFKSVVHQVGSAVKSVGSTVGNAVSTVYHDGKNLVGTVVGNISSIPGKSLGVLDHGITQVGSNINKGLDVLPSIATPLAIAGAAILGIILLKG